MLSNDAQHRSILSGDSLRDFGELKPKEERKIVQESLRWREVPSWNPFEGDDACDLEYTAGEANEIA